MIVDGKEIAARILAETRAQIAGLGRTPSVLAIAVSPTAATESYLKIKSARAKDAGMELVVERFPDTASEEEIIMRITSAQEDAVIVQLPLPASLDTKRILDAIPFGKDADVLGNAAREAFALSGMNAAAPPVVAAVAHLIAMSDISPHGVRAVVVGDGWLVGNPVALWLKKKGIPVTVVTRENESTLRDALQDADIVVSGAGHAGLITKGMVKEGAILIDAGTSESNGEMVGDMDPGVAAGARLFTPVPGGVGPIAVACLYANAAALVAPKAPGVY